MKKLLYLFFVVTVIACSKDDDNQPQTFTEKYNGVVWSDDNSPSDRTYFIAISKDNNKIFNWDDSYSYCDYFEFSIEENTSNSLIIIDNADQTKFRLKVINDGNTLNVEEYYGDIDGWEDVETFSRSSTANPCL